MALLHIGFDDTDSLYGMCTTYLAYKIVEFLLEHSARVVDHPLLIRLNPNIPWKTRGNGAVALCVEIDNEDIVFLALSYSNENNFKMMHELSSHLILVT